MSGDRSEREIDDGDVGTLVSDLVLEGSTLSVIRIDVNFPSDVCSLLGDTILLSNLDVTLLPLL